MKLNSILLVILFSTFFSCKDSQKEHIAQRVQLLNNISEFGATPVHQEFEKDCEELLKAVLVFKSVPNTGNLAFVRSQWHQIGKGIKKCELYDIGAINSSFIHPRIYRWPTNIKRLEKYIQTDTSFTTQKIADLGSNLIGIAAIEYLLFENDTETTLQAFQNEPKRLQYLQAITTYLVSKAKELNNVWKNYQPKFESALERKITGSQNQILNILISNLEKTAKTALGKPLGENNGGRIVKQSLEAHYSDASLDLIKSGFKEWKHCFNGDYTHSTDSYGFDDYLIALGNKDLVDRIEASIQSCDIALDALSSLNHNLEQKTEKVVALKNAFTALSVLVKIEVSGSIGATITVSDADGD